MSSGRFSFQVDTVINPLEARIWNDAYVEIVRDLHNEVIEVVPFAVPITVMAERFIGSVRQSNNFRNATNVYYFYINHDLNLANGSSLRLTIGNISSWNVHSASLLFGFSSPSTAEVVINNTANYSTVTVWNYGNASRKVQQTIGINLTSPVEIGYQPVTVEAVINDNVVGVWEGDIWLNGTFGQCSLLSLTAVREKVKVPVNATGSL
jgi:hypothetical protein